MVTKSKQDYQREPNGDCLELHAFEHRPTWILVCFGDYSSHFKSDSREEIVRHIKASAILLSLLNVY